LPGLLRSNGRAHRGNNAHGKSKGADCTHSKAQRTGARPDKPTDATKIIFDGSSLSGGGVSASQVCRKRGKKRIQKAADDDDAEACFCN